jgi:hypothetical protein
LVSHGPPLGWNGGLPAGDPADVQRLPAQIDAGPPAGATLVRADGPSDSPGFDDSVTEAIAPTLTDLVSADYDDSSLVNTGGMPFMRLEVGTPKPGTCWTELANTALSAYGGSEDVAVEMPEHPGPLMAAQRLVLLCATQVGILNLCAWAGPGADGHHPLYGMLAVPPSFSLQDSPRINAELTAYAERVFEALLAR